MAIFISRGTFGIPKTYGFQSDDVSNVFFGLKNTPITLNFSGTGNLEIAAVSDGNILNLKSITDMTLSSMTGVTLAQTGNSVTLTHTSDSKTYALNAWNGGSGGSATSETVTVTFGTNASPPAIVITRSANGTYSWGYNLTGSTGNDDIYGGIGTDTITGGAGTDSINAGIGADIITGDAGDDVFFLDNSGVTVWNVGIDTITDFGEGSGIANRNTTALSNGVITGLNGDILQFSNADLASLTGFSNTGSTAYVLPTALNGSTILATGLVQNVNGTPAYTGTTLQFGYNGFTGVLYLDADGGASGASPIEIAIIATGLTLTETDFLIVG